MEGRVIRVPNESQFEFEAGTFLIRDWGFDLGLQIRRSLASLLAVVNILSQPFGDDLCFNLAQKSGSGFLLNFWPAEWRRMESLDAGGDMLHLHEISSNGSAGPDDDITGAKHRSAAA
jgi:hypothetical protein